MLTTAVADRTRYSHIRYHASADLDTCVEHFWSVRWDLRGVTPERAETLPHPSVQMIFEHNGGGQIAGVARGKFSRLLEGEGGVFAAKFRPGGFYQFVGVPMSAYTDTVQSLGDVFGRDGDVLEADVRSARDDPSRIAVIEDFLRGRATESGAQVARIAEIVYAAAADRTILRVDDLVERYGMNTRALQRLFAQYVGVSPKWVIQRYRLHEAAEQLAGGPVHQSTLALSLGYSDQAHFVRDFKRVVGISPASYAKAARGKRHDA